MRALVAAALLAGGAVTGLAAVALHERWWGLLLAAAATAVTLVALPAGWWSRLAFALGWTGLAGLVTVPRPEGDYVVSEDAAGYLLLALALLVLLAGIVTLPIRPGMRSPAPVGPGSPARRVGT